MSMDYDLLKCRNGAEEAETASGRLRRGYARVQHVSQSDEYFDLRGLGRHEQKFRNWCKKKWPALSYRIYFGGVND